MNKIGFQNFRRFDNFQPIEYKDVTFLVGRNNSGKSTLVKALLLIIDYLKSEDVRIFSFSKTNIEDVNIVTYGRAKCKNRPDDNFIEFELQFDDLKIDITVTGKEDSTNIDVRSYRISDLSSGLIFSLDPVNSTISISSISQIAENKPSESEFLLIQLIEKESDLKNQIKIIEDKLSEDYIHANNELKNLKQKIKTIRASNRKNIINKDNFLLDTHYRNVVLKDILEEAIGEFSSEYEMQYHDIQKGKKPKKSFENLKAFKDNKFKIETTVSELIKKINQTTTVYLGATLNKQSALFAIRDKSNGLAQVIHEYKQLGIDKEPASDAFVFVKNWISEAGFEIGESFEIKMHAGEAYEVVVKSNGIEIPLADKGMGSIQAMLLILRLATLIHKKQKDKKNYTIIIEEPELNLHPALQSKLADLFLYVNSKYGIKLIIETHSEYIIRRSQVLVAEKELEIPPNQNPFCVYYFPKGLNNLPYDMGYQSDGIFKKNFEEGFFDEASSSTLELLRLKRQKQA